MSFSFRLEFWELTSSTLTPSPERRSEKAEWRDTLSKTQSEASNKTSAGRISIKSAFSLKVLTVPLLVYNLTGSASF